MGLRRVDIPGVVSYVMDMGSPENLSRHKKSVGVTARHSLGRSCECLEDVVDNAVHENRATRGGP